MNREKRLLKYFNELGQLEKDIVIGKAAELYQNRMTESETVTIPVINCTAGEMPDALGKGTLNKIMSYEEVHQDEKSEKYYEDLIEGIIPARNGFEKAIQCTKKDAGMALAMIGLDHPASKIVHKYLAKQKYEQTGRWSHLLCRHFAYHANNQEVAQALVKTKSLDKAVKEYKENVPVQHKKSAVELVLEQALEKGEVTHLADTGNLPD